MFAHTPRHDRGFTFGPRHAHRGQRHGYGRPAFGVAGPRPTMPGPFMHHGPRPECGFQRRFLTRAERIAALEGYLNALETEAQAVRERIEAMKGIEADKGIEAKDQPDD